MILQTILAATILAAIYMAYMIGGIVLINWVRRNCKDTGYYDVLLPLLVIVMPMQAFFILYNLKTSWTYDQEKRNF